MDGPPVQRALAVLMPDAVRDNCARIARGLHGAALCAVVKANGYGHGAVDCAEAALDGGATWLAVAAAQEAADLRARALGESSPIANARILVMGALTPDELDAALGADSDVAVWRQGFLDLVAERAGETRPRVHVKYDTGMGRLGERDPDAVRDLVRTAAADDRVELAGLWTHFATADELDSEFFDDQLARFREVALPLKEELPSLKLHAANSAATLRARESHFDMVRCGIAIYGLDPFQRDPASRDLEPALELHSYVASVKRFPKGASAGYGRTWRAPEDTWVGVLPIGYGDGVRRALSNNCDVLVGGRRYPLVGTVSMDNITIDLGSDPSVEPGDPAVLIGAQGEERLLAEEMAARLDTINYEITCGISERVDRSLRSGISFGDGDNGS
jgi:alanine racemase